MDRFSSWSVCCEVLRGLLLEGGVAERSQVLGHRDLILYLLLVALLALLSWAKLD